VADLDQLQHRVAELEERLDFAERLLAQRRDAERLPGG
jgi:tetrahydromethanopterin S-methyltransferase subunit G